MSKKLIPILDNKDLEKVTSPLAKAYTLPALAYTDPGIFKVEVEEIFHKDWVCVARVEQIAAPGDYLCVDLPHQPLVITHDLNGELHALSRICLHRAMPIAHGRGNATRLVCPYHNWTYNLDGHLRSAPMMDGIESFERAKCKLPEISLEIWHGFIFVNMDKDTKPLASQLGGLNNRIQNYHFEDLLIAGTLEFESNWNWKILVENFMEAYHHIGTHRKSLEPIFPAKKSQIPDNNSEPWTFLEMPGESNESEELSSFPLLSEDQRKSLFAANVYPTLLFAASNLSGIWYQVTVQSEKKFNLKIHLLLHHEMIQKLPASALKEIMAELNAIHVEDISANEGSWTGLNSSLTIQGRLSLFEKAVWQLNQIWVQRITDVTSKA
ncbi:MAG: phenylpropionate dioxygenase-like ring-hydroxylating dioxygenase large terminal subunit [Candidatus Azotimanducaceae bacterium]|jgi:phenylpropionate dioxygenase-like ring-hydroxylating dioxygenase large terminal subunit